MNINLVKLARFAGARLIHQSVKSVDINSKVIYLNNKARVNYDVLSLNCGAAPDLSSIPGAERYAVAVKPISLFLDKLPTVGKISGPVCIIGAGAAGTELALAFRHRYGPSVDIHVIGRNERVLPTRSQSASQLLTKALTKSNINLHLGQAVREIKATDIQIGKDTRLDYGHLFLVTSARPAEWLANLPVSKDSNGYIEVSNKLQSVSNDDIFAAGDVATISGFEREKAGVFAVRAGPFLSYNLRAFIRGAPLKSWHPQRKYLTVIGLGNGQALASWGLFSASGRFWWNLKAFIDKSFMQKFSELPVMSQPPFPFTIPNLAKQKERKSDMTDAMFCAACGAKTGDDTLQSALQTACEIAKDAGADPDYLPEQTTITDYAEVSVPTGVHSLSQSVDYISQHISDPFCLGELPPCTPCLIYLFLATTSICLSNSHPATRS